VLFTKTSTATADMKIRTHAVFFLRARIIQRALDLASAVTTHLTASGFAAQSVNMLFQVCFPPAAPRARLAWRLCGFVTNSPEYCRLVFSENVVVRGLWNTLGYIELGMIPRAAQKNDGTYQDAMIMFRSLLD